MRKDVSVTNDSGGLSLLSSSVVDRVIADTRGDDAAFSRAHEALLFTLPGDESFIARVVLDEPLTPAEEAAWVARVSTRLKVPCGRLLVCGGFDPRMLEMWRDEGENDEEAYTREIKIPPGEYRVDFYSHMPSMVASVIREEWPEKMGSWFRRENPGAAFPQWLADALGWSPEEDPGFEDVWEDAEAAVQAGKLKVAGSPSVYVQYLAHLRKGGSSDGPMSELGEDGWFMWTTGERKPEKFPHAVPAEGVQPR